MDNKNNDGDDYEEYIREPDSVKTERLIDDFIEEDINLLEDNLIQDSNINLFQRTVFDNINMNINTLNKEEVNNVFEESKKDFEEKIKREYEYEKQIMQHYFDTVEKNKAKFQPLINDLIRLSKFDTEIKEIYDILEYVIESYCAQVMPYVEFDIETYNRMFKILGSIRSDKKCIEELKNVIICET